MNNRNYYTAVIILNYNNFEDTINCIESVEKYNTGRIKLIIVDNASKRKGATESLEHYLIGRYDSRLSIYTDPISDISEKKCLTYCSYIKSKNNDGYACGNNKALKLTELDSEIKYVMILNNDVLFVQDIIPILVKRYSETPDAAILSPLLYKRNMEGFDYNCARNDTTLTAELIDNFFFYVLLLLRIENPLKKRRYLLRQYKTLPDRIQIELPSGSCMFISKSIFKQIGYFDPNTFLYFEENILYRKVLSIGRKNYIFTDLKCIHLGAQSTSHNSYSPEKARLHMQSPLYYMKKYYGLTILQFCLYRLSVRFFLFTQRIRNFFKQHN